ncbi:ABC transporter substrate-binding protein [Pollutimonas harenae]|uniref:ABC transporter substrate-binding protein n=1 Tax=Pollutimonas harenae TaxID=657015 RepID=A0A853GSR1_9BURK|nr:ABC transporter substrate-binding protein [Pollutimonas harenae]NYT86158.1 ABC transporter substrate-binding protein [Pollutimonas harenae]TEA71195.1 ABC transporter substrate-binding protein [Pollutimonas harenae]
MVLRFARACVLICLMLSSAMAGAQPITVTDAAGRNVTLQQPAKRIILTQARHLQVLALLHPDPVSILAGWSDEFRSSFSNEYQSYLERFPAIANIPIVGRHTADTFSVEKALALQPDLLLLTASFAGIGKGQDPNDSLIIRQFEAAGIPVLIIDFFVQPMENTVPSLRALGKALGQEVRSEAFIKLYESHMAAVAERLADLPPDERPAVFVHAHAGSTDCCNSPGTGTFSEMVEYAGGHNIGSDVLKTVTGRLSFEYINSRNPDVYVATGTGSGKRTRTGLTIGAGATEEEARLSLERVIDNNRLGALPAIRHGNAHGIWHAFNDSPLHVIFIEALAGWIHPERFAGISAQKTLDEINQRFLTVPLQGTYMVNLNK